MERALMTGPGLRPHLFPMAPPASVRGALLLAAATLRSLLTILRTRPAVTFATGGYVSVPASIASWIARVPLVLFLPDVVPGRAIAWLGPMARRIAVTADAARSSLPAAKVVVTGYPVRPAFLHASGPDGRKQFELPSDATVLCVLGGSQGARSLNQALVPLLPDLLRTCHIIHVCGEKRLAEAVAAVQHLPPDLRHRYRLFPYLQEGEMAAALAAADLAVCRSGASVLGELPLTGTPAVLVPFPDPAVHQQENAEYLAEHGAAVVVADARLADCLGPVLLDLLPDRERLERMARACRSLARPDATAAIAAVIRETGA